MSGSCLAHIISYFILKWSLKISWCIECYPGLSGCSGTEDLLFAKCPQGPSPDRGAVQWQPLPASQVMCPPLRCECSSSLFAWIVFVFRNTFSFLPLWCVFLSHLSQPLNNGRACVLEHETRPSQQRLFLVSLGEWRSARCSPRRLMWTSIMCPAAPEDEEVETTHTHRGSHEMMLTLLAEQY